MISRKNESSWRRAIRSAVAMMLASLLIAGASPAMAAGNILVQFDGIKGPSVERQFEGAIEALSWSWGMSQLSATTSTERYATGSKVDVNSLSFTQYVDQTSPILMDSCASGKHINKARVVLRAPGRDGMLTYMVLDLEDVMIAGIELGSDSAEPTVVTVSLRFGKYKITYQPYSSDGKSMGTVQSGWDLTTNKRL